MTLQEITLELRIVDITAIHDCLRQKRNLCSPLRIIIRINMPFFISYDSLYQTRADNEPFTEFFGLFIEKQRKWYF